MQGLSPNSETLRLNVYSEKNSLLVLCVNENDSDKRATGHACIVRILRNIGDNLRKFEMTPNYPTFECKHKLKSASDFGPWLLNIRPRSLAEFSDIGGWEEYHFGGRLRQPANLFKGLSHNPSASVWRRNRRETFRGRRCRRAQAGQDRRPQSRDFPCHRAELLVPIEDP
jgi:hypothetical protein